MRRLWAPLILLSLMSLTACSIEDKPHYLIDDATLHQYEAGDKLTYSVLDAAIDNDRTGNYILSLESRDEFPPSSNQTRSLLLENQTRNGNFSLPLLPHLFFHNEDGDYVLDAISHSDDILWLSDENDSETGVILYPNDIETLSNTKTFSKTLQRCDENNVCLDAGQYALQHLTLVGKETITTRYATFESFKLTVSINVSIIDIKQAGNQKNYHLSGTQWVYPPLGVVKFYYNLNNPNGSSSLIGDLLETNISIDEAYKQE